MKKRRRIMDNFILILAIVVFCGSGYQLIKGGKSYREGEKEYKEVAKIAVEEKDTKKPEIDFEKLKELNKDVIGWIRFEQPEIINYPVVQGKDNEEYLHKTFKGFDNTVGCIFMNAYNGKDFQDTHTIIYGHRMNNKTMFHELEKYKEEKFWEKHPSFLIYTPDGRCAEYTIYAVAQVDETSDCYQYQFADEKEVEEFIKLTKKNAFYDTEIEVEKEDKILTLSTCTKENNEQRLVVHAVQTKVEE